MTEAEELLHLSSEGVAAEKALQQEVQTVCFIYPAYFCSLNESHKLRGSEGLGESVNLLLCDLLYIVRRQQDL